MARRPPRYQTLVGCGNRQCAGGSERRNGLGGAGIARGSSWRGGPKRIPLREEEKP